MKKNFKNIFINKYKNFLLNINFNRLNINHHYRVLITYKNNHPAYNQSSSNYYFFMMLSQSSFLGTCEKFVSFRALTRPSSNSSSSVSESEQPLSFRTFFFTSFFTTLAIALSGCVQSSRH